MDKNAIPFPDRRSPPGPTAQQQVNALTERVASLAEQVETLRADNDIASVALVEAQTEIARQKDLNESTDAALRLVQGDLLGARGAALREAAALCISLVEKHDIHSNFICANAIRALASSAPVKVQGVATAQWPTILADYRSLESDWNAIMTALGCDDTASALAKIALAAPAAGVQVAPKGWRDHIAELREASYTLTQYPELAHIIYDSITEAFDELEAREVEAPSAGSVLTDAQAEQIFQAMMLHVDDWSERAAVAPTSEECSGEAIRFMLAAIAGQSGEDGGPTPSA
jgi:uncharacterized protein YfiM (DUF2279 family)